MTDDSQNQPRTPTQSDLLGWVTPVVIWFSKVILAIPEAIYSSREEAQNRLNDGPYIRRRTLIVDSYVVACLILDTVAFSIATNSASCIVVCLALAFAGFQILSVLAVTLRIGLLGELVKKPNRPPTVASHERIVVLGILNYIQLIVCFAAFYAVKADLIKSGGAKDWVDPLYLSAVTQLTIGYGDLHPSGWLRWVAMVQGLFAFVLAVVLIGRFTALLRQIQSLTDGNAAADKNVKKAGGES